MTYAVAGFGAAHSARPAAQKQRFLAGLRRSKISLET